jgi:hypothetical protein
LGAQGRQCCLDEESETSAENEKDHGQTIREEIAPPVGFLVFATLIPILEGEWTPLRAIQ